MVLAYRHAFHAGNHADVWKHSVHAVILHALCSQQQQRGQRGQARSIVYLDTHAASGVYDLVTDAYAQKRQEYRSGIERVWQRQHDAPLAFAPFLSVCRAVNRIAPSVPTTQPRTSAQSAAPSSSHDGFVGVDAETAQRVLAAFHLPTATTTATTATTAVTPAPLRFYPGSPAYFAHLSEECGASPTLTSMTACDLHPTEHSLLADYVRRASRQLERERAAQPRSRTTAPYVPLQQRCRIVRVDGFTSDTLLPTSPSTLPYILMDPPYELANEYDRVAPFVARTLERCPHATMLIWYPLLAGKEHLARQLLRSIAQLGLSASSSSAFYAELNLRKSLESQLVSGGAERSATATQAVPRLASRLSLFGSGLIAINPLPHLDVLMQHSMLPYLARVLVPGEDASSSGPGEFHVTRF